MTACRRQFWLSCHEKKGGRKKKEKKGEAREKQLAFHRDGLGETKVIPEAVAYLGEKEKKKREGERKGGRPMRTLSWHLSFAKCRRGLVHPRRKEGKRERKEKKKRSVITSPG